MGLSLKGFHPCNRLQVEVEEYRNGERVACQALLPANTELKETKMLALRSSVINQAAIAFLHDPAPQADQPQLGNRQRQQQAGHPITVGHATAVEVKAAALPITEHRLDPQWPHSAAPATSETVPTPATRYRRGR